MPGYGDFVDEDYTFDQPNQYESTPTGMNFGPAPEGGDEQVGPTDYTDYETSPTGVVYGPTSEGGNAQYGPLLSTLGGGIDKSLLSTVSSFLGNNKELSSMLLSGLGSAMKSESALQLYNRMNDDKLATQKRYNESVTNAKPVNMGLIGSNMIKSIRGQA